MSCHTLSLFHCLPYEDLRLSLYIDLKYLLSMDEITTYSGYESLVEGIGTLLDSARAQIATSVNTVLVQTYWNIGKYIVDYEQAGAQRAEYGSNLLNRLSDDLTHRYGKGFSRSNVYNMRKLYLTYPKVQTLSGFLAGAITSKSSNPTTHWKSTSTPRSAKPRNGASANSNVRRAVF